MDAKQLAEHLNDIECERLYRMHHDMKGYANDGLVVVYGSGDDLLECDGLIADEIGASGGGAFLIDVQGFVEDWESVEKGEEAQMRRYFLRKDRAKKIEVEWAPPSLPQSWIISAEFEHHTFEILEDGEPFCTGIVFHIDALKG